MQSFELTAPELGEQLYRLEISGFINEFGPQHMNKVEQYFGDLGGEVSKSQFASLVLLALEQRPSNRELMRVADEVFGIIDVRKRGKVRFSEFTTFLIQAEEMMNRDQSLRDIRILRCPEEDIKHSSDRVFPLDQDQMTALLDCTHAYIEVFDSMTYKPLFKIAPSSTVVVAALYLPRQSKLLLSTNNKFLNVFDLADKQFILAFKMEQLQVHLALSQDKGVVYCCSSQGKIYQFSLQLLCTSSASRKEKGQPKEPISEIYKLYLAYPDRKPLPEQEAGVTSLLVIDDIELLVTGCVDKAIRLYNNKRELSHSCKRLRGHGKQIKEICYCKAQKHLVSCSFDFEVLVWNAYLDHPIARLQGHQAPLLSVVAPDEHPVIVTLDSQGIVKIWSNENHTLLQTINHKEFGRVKCLAYSKSKQRFYLTFKQTIAYRFHISHSPTLTDDSEIRAILVSQQHRAVYVAASKNLKVWSLESGTLQWVFKNVVEGETVAMAFDKHQRRVFMGTQQGRIFIVDAKTGFRIGALNQHVAEISLLRYSCKFELVVSGSWDRLVKVHNDTTHLELPQTRKNILRIIKECHPTEIILGDFSDSLYLIATCARQPLVRVWDFEKGALEFELRCANEINVLKFMDPYPLLLGADVKGLLLLWALPPLPRARSLLVSWKNMFTIQKASPVTCLNHKVIGGDLVVFAGDQSGYIKVLGLAEVLRRTESGVELKDSASVNKNPYRIEDRRFVESGEKSDPLQPLFQLEKNIKQLRLFKAHSTRIEDIQLIHSGKQLHLVSLGTDVLVKLWSLEGDCLGVLKQEYTVNPSWQVRFVADSSAEVNLESLAKMVRGDLPAIQKLHKSKQVPFSQLDDEPLLSRVDSRDILANLKEVDQILNRER